MHSKYLVYGPAYASIENTGFVASLPHVASTHCISLQNDNYHRVNSVRVQKMNMGTGGWEDVVLASNMNTSSQAINIISFYDPEAVSNL